MIQFIFVFMQSGGDLNLIITFIIAYQHPLSLPLFLVVINSSFSSDYQVFTVLFFLYAKVGVWPSFSRKLKSDVFTSSLFSLFFLPSS